MRSIVASLCVLLITPAAFAQDSSVSTATEPGATEAAMDPESQRAHEGLRELRRTMEEALNNGDIDAILAHVDERVVFTTMNGDVARGKDGIRQYYEKMMQGPDRVVQSVTSSFEADDLSILHGGNMAIAFGHAKDHYVLTGGKAFDITARWSGTMLRRDDGQWNVASFHYSGDIFDNPILNEQRRILIIAAVAFAVIVGVAGYWWGRRRRAAG